MNAVLDRKGNEIKVGSTVKAKGSAILRAVSQIETNSGPDHDAIVLTAYRIDQSETSKGNWTRLLASNAEVVA